MQTLEVAPSLEALFRELVHGPPAAGAFMLNPGDAGLLNSLGRLSASAASVTPNGGACIAAHVEHLRYGLSLMNRWATGENPFADANWAASWEMTSVTEVEWLQLRRALRDQAERWLDTLGTPRSVVLVELNGMIASIVHLAYHTGAMRQIDRILRGPAAAD